MFEILASLLQLLQQCALIAFLVVLAYTVYKMVHYFTSSDSKTQAIDDAKEQSWNSGQHILIGHQATTQSVLKQIVDNKEKSIDEGTYIKFSDRLKQIKAEFGEESEIQIHIRTPGGEMFYAMLIAHLIYLWKGKVTAHIHQMSCSGGTLIALACSQIVMESDSVLGPIDPQVPKRVDFSSVTQLLLAASIDPLNVNENSVFSPLVPLTGRNASRLLSKSKETKEKGDDDDGEEEKIEIVESKTTGVTVRVAEKSDEESAMASEMFVALKLNILVLDALHLLKTYKSFLHRILKKNYPEDKIEQIIRFFWISRPHSTPIFMEECKKVGLFVVCEGEEEEEEEEQEKEVK